MNETEEIVEALRPAFYSKDRLIEVYLEILNRGPEVTQEKIAQEINTRENGRTKQPKRDRKIKQIQIFRDINKLSREGFILRRTRGKKSEHFLINPKMLWYISYLETRKNSPKLVKKLEDFMDQDRDLIEKLERRWKENRVGLGDQMQADIFDVHSWRGDVTLANVCGWIDTFREEVRTEEQEITFFTPNLRLVTDDVFPQLMNRVLTDLNCRITFFVKPEKLKDYDDIRDDLAKGPTYEMYPIPSYMFIDYLRVVLIGDVLGLICLNRSKNYVGTIFYRYSEHLRKIQGYFDELKKVCKKY